MIAQAQSAKRDPERTAYPRRRLRIFHLLTCFDIGGTERQAVELLLHIDPVRYDVRLGVLRPGGPLYERLAVRFPEVLTLRLTSFYSFRAARQVVRLRRLLVQDQIDVLHAHDFYSSLLGVAAGRLAGVRVLASQRHMRLFDSRVYDWGQRLIHRLADRILVNSEAIRDLIVNAGSASPQKVVLIRNGLIPAESGACQSNDSGPDRPVREELLATLGLNGESKLIGVVARLQPVKGHRYLVEAAARVCSQRPDAHFVLIGDGPLRADIEDQVRRLGLDGRVHLPGFRPDGARVAGAFDLAALPSLHEGFPNAVIEAMAAGVPAVATASGGTRELIRDGETGWLVPAADPEALADRILHALECDSERKDIADRGRRFVLSSFSVTRMVHEVEQLYEVMTRESRPGKGPAVEAK